MDKAFKNSKKNFQINGFRVVLLLLVIFYHFLIVFSKQNTEGLSVKYNYIPGQAATCVFLVISGWFLSIKTVGSFWYKKLFRIILPFTIAIGLIIGVRFLVGQFRISGLDVAMNILIFPMNSNLFAYIDGAHWYITVLIYFFIVYTLGYLIDKITKKEISFWLFFALMFVCLLVTIFIKPANTFFKIVRCVFPSHFVFIIFGLLLSKLYKNPFTKLPINIFLIAVLFLFSCLNCFFSFDWYQLIFFVVLLVLLTLCHFKLIKLFEWKPLQVIGDASLWVYLLHQEIGCIIIKPFYENNLYWLGVIVASISMIGVGIGISFLWNQFALKSAFKFLYNIDN